MSLTFNQTLKFSLPFFLLLSEVFAFAEARKVPSSPSMTEPKMISQNYNWHEFVKFIDIGRGRQVTGVSEIKRYLNRFGYLQAADKTFTDLFDEELESSIVSYQKFFGLPITGKLDRTTIASIAAPRCGVVDIYPDSSTRISRYTYFSGLPRWDHQTPMTLTYAVSPYYTVDYLSQEVIQAVLWRAFSRWAAVVPINFTEAANYETANIRLGFHSGNHGDGAPFDGVLGVLAHAFMPEDGRLHFDSAETWAVDFETEKSKTAVDLESVAMHEIGHILGLGHSRTKEAIMYPRLKPRRRKLELWVDDVEGIQALYGPNPDFKMSSLMESERSGDSGRRGKYLFIGMSSWCWLVAVLVFGFFLQNDAMMMMAMTSRRVIRAQKQKENNRLGKKTQL